MKSLKVIGIFDRQDIVFSFDRSPFFIVGPNGTGKSTALKILHNILTASWSRIKDLPFAGVEIEFDNSVHVFDKADFEKISRISNLMARSMRRPAKRGFVPFPTSWDVARKFLTGTHNQAAKNIRRLPESAYDSYAEIYESAVQIINFVEQETRGRVLYFPTYRRVEKDLRELLETEDPFDEIPSIAPEIVDRFQSAGEVVGFGGQDIRTLLEKTASEIEVSAREALNEHSVRFLEALSTDRAGATKQAKDFVKSEDKIARLLDRVATFGPSSINTAAIANSIEKLRLKLTAPKAGRLSQQEEMMLFYIGELMELFNKVDESSAPLQNFSNLITTYLSPVKRSYLREADNRVIILDGSETEIEMDQLSSGEKQILAFFAFLLLKTEVKSRFIIIDEPELSLSVSWQKALIRDIARISGSAYITCATHSPFIFDSFDLDHVHTLGDL